ncbi:hypothetical protein TeGR_g1073, partial [Tetraparma gracilis]
MPATTPANPPVAATPAAPVKAEGAAPAAGLSLDMLQGALAGMAQQGGAGATQMTPLTETVTADAVLESQILDDPAVVAKLLPLLPAGQQTEAALRDNLRSPQVRQALGSLQSALAGDSFNSVLANFQLDTQSERVQQAMIQGNAILAFLESVIDSVEKGKGNISSSFSSPDGGRTGLSPDRWVMLGYLSILALLSDWVCFSNAASPHTFEALYPDHSYASLIDMFLFTNVFSSFLVTDTISKVGLSNAIKASSLLMFFGCLLRSAGVALGLEATPYEFVLAGTLCVGAAQPFFQCTPPLLSATWFGSSERATATAIALNFNQIGIATAFLIGGSMATSASGLSDYFLLLAGIAGVVSAGTLLQFQERPPLPPSTSQLNKLVRNEMEPPFVDSLKSFFK